jgi:hypothetical protein
VSTPGQPSSLGRQLQPQRGQRGQVKIGFNGQKRRQTTTYLGPVLRLAFFIASGEKIYLGGKKIDKVMRKRII